MNINKFYEGLIRTDIVCRHIPGLSMISSFANFILKTVLITEKNDQNNPYYFYLSRLNFASLTYDALPIPVISILNSLINLCDGNAQNFVEGDWNVKEHKGYLELCLHSSINKKEFILEAIKTKETIQLLKYAGFKVIHDKEFILQMIEINPNAFAYAAKILKDDFDIIKTALHKDVVIAWSNLKRHSCEIFKNSEIPYEAMRAYQKQVAASDQAKEFIALYEQTYPLPDHIQKRIDYNISSDPYAHVSIKYSDREKALILAGVDGLRIAFMPKNLRNDRDIAFTAYLQNPKALDFVEDIDLQRSLKVLKIFAMIILQAEELLKLSDTEINRPAKRFFKIVGQLPLDLQIIMANVACGLAKEGVSKGFDRMARKLITI